MGEYRERKQSYTSSDDDDFENFLSKVRTPKPAQKFRLSTGSLSDFLVNESHATSTSENEDDADEESNASPMLQPLSQLPNIKHHTPHIIQNTPVINTNFSSASGNEEIIFVSPKSGNKTTFAKKSVATPRKTVVFSSDSGEEEFETKPAQNLQLATASLSVFTTNRIHETSAPNNEDEGRDKEYETLHTPESLLQLPNVKHHTPYSVHKTPVIKRTFSSASDNEDLSYRSPITKTKTPVSKKYVATPQKSVVFSSDSDDENFRTQHPVLRLSNSNNSDEEPPSYLPNVGALTLHNVPTPDKRGIIYSSRTNKDNVFESPATGKMIPGLKKMTTPRKSVVFSSDSEDDISVTQKPVLRRSVNSSSDENDIIPSLVDRIKLTNLEDSTLCGKENLPKNTGVVDLTGKSFTSLTSRILKPKQPESILDRRPPSLGSYITPKRKPTSLKGSQTEKVFRTKPKCKVDGCFLASLDALVPQNSGKQFRRNADSMTKKLFKLFNTSVFDNRLPEDMEVSWSKRLTKTAGITKCKRTIRTVNGTASTTHHAAISLSEKVIDSSYRLRDTLIHEMCHAAVWLINNANESHGPYWKAWAATARRIHPELPSIDRCHNYDIEYKYIYECSRCKTTIGRHSKSIDTTKKVCGRCRGPLVLTQPNGTPLKSQPLNPFAKFVKENYKTTKLRLQSSEVSSSHKDVMTSLSQQFKSASLN
ncbi:uncharacterized protein LOC100181834 [Ciona intestinalis]